MSLPPTGLPIGLVKHLRDRLSISVFIETGTGNGRTLSIVEDLFPRVYTIEMDESKWQKVHRVHDDPPFVNCMLGDTLAMLPHVLEKVDRQSIVFLDAHCAGAGAVGSTSCPLLDEIAIVLDDGSNHVIIVDDWILFSFPTNVERRHEWPEIAEVIDALRDGDFEEPPYIFEWLGNRESRPQVLISVPRYAKKYVEEYRYGGRV